MMRIRCTNTKNYTAEKEPTCGCTECSLMWTLRCLVLTRFKEELEAELVKAQKGKRSNANLGLDYVINKIESML